MADIRNYQIYESNLEKILANVKKEFEKSGKQFNDVFKSFKDTWNEQTKEINSFVSGLKNENGKIDFKNLLSGGLYNTKNKSPANMIVCAAVLMQTLIYLKLRRIITKKDIICLRKKKKKKLMKTV